MENTYIKIYVTNLGKYNEGELLGTWVDLPCDDWNAVFDKIKICHDDIYYCDSCGNPYEELFITDYESNIGISIGEYDNIYELSDLAETLQDADPNVISALLYFGVSYEDIVDEIDNIICYSDCNDMSDVAYEYVNECGLLRDMGNLANYFDYEAFGRDMDIEGHFYFASDGNCYQYIG